MSHLYQTEEWKSLGPTRRAQLLLVIEGLKKGTIIGGNWGSFIGILDKTGLSYSLNTSRFRLDPGFEVAKLEDLLEQQRLILSLPKNASIDEYHKIAGLFLSYPTCCTEEYLRERTPEEQLAKRNGQRYLSYKFGRELYTRIQTEGSYPNLLDYRPPSFTPCGIECPNANALLMLWKDALVKLDPEAGDGLVYLNRTGLPENLAHRDYLRNKWLERRKEDLSNFLKQSVDDPHLLYSHLIQQKRKH